VCVANIGISTNGQVFGIKEQQIVLNVFNYKKVGNLRKLDYKFKLLNLQAFLYERDNVCIKLYR